MAKRPSVADAISRKLREGEGGSTAGESVPAPEVASAPVAVDPGTARVAGARTRIGKKFITFPVSGEAKLQFDMLAVQMGTRREELMREALRDLFSKHGQTPID